MRRLKEHNPGQDAAPFLEANAPYHVFAGTSDEDEAPDNPTIVAETRVDIPHANVADAVMMLARAPKPWFQRQRQLQQRQQTPVAATAAGNCSAESKRHSDAESVSRRTMTGSDSHAAFLQAGTHTYTHTRAHAQNRAQANKCA